MCMSNTPKYQSGTHHIVSEIRGSEDQRLEDQTFCTPQRRAMATPARPRCAAHSMLGDLFVGALLTHVSPSAPGAAGAPVPASPHLASAPASSRSSITNTKARSNKTRPLVDYKTRGKTRGLKCRHFRHAWTWLNRVVTWCSHRR